MLEARLTVSKLACGELVPSTLPFDKLRVVSEVEPLRDSEFIELPNRIEARQSKFDARFSTLNSKLSTLYPELLFRLQELLKFLYHHHCRTDDVQPQLLKSLGSLGTVYPTGYFSNFEFLLD